MMAHPRWILALLLAALGAFSAAAANPFPALEKAGDRFSFVINADPHVNNERPGQKNPSPHNQCFREFIREINAMAPQPAFVLFNGDNFERAAAPVSTRIFLEGAAQLKALPILVAGNHDARTFDVGAIFEPAQRALNSTTATQFGFDCGQWHFAVLPPPELITPENEAEVLNKLDADLKANRTRPTMVFLHYHILPVGLSQLEFYTLSIGQKNRLLNVLTRYGNVKYVFSGHVHSGVMPSVKTAWSYKGTTFVVAPSPVKPRPFGEEYKEFTLEGGYYMVVDVNGTEAKLTGRQIGYKAEHTYPARFPEFKPEAEPRAMAPLGDLPANERLANGDFASGLQGWWSPLRYAAENGPGYSARAVAADGGNWAELMVKAKGQNWAYGEFTELYQVVQAPREGAPTLSLNYKPLDAQKTAGGYVWAAALKGREVAAVMLLKWGPPLEQRHTLPKVISYLVTEGELRKKGLAQLAAEKRALFWNIPESGGKAHALKLNLAEAYDQANGAGAFKALGVEKMLVGIGTWCMETEGSQSKALFGGVELKGVGAANEEERSTIDGQPLAKGSGEMTTIIRPEAAPAAKGKKKRQAAE